MMELIYKPIAFFHSSHQETYEAPRQGVLAERASGWFELGEGFGADSLEDLAGFERIWILYDFHQNKTWKPKVRPPRFSEKKRSIFSTRSPYRPNQIGLSCVKLLKIEGKKVYVTGHDILEGSPILDIKPYLPYADSFPDSDTGWVKLDQGFEVKFTEAALEKILWLENFAKIDITQIVSNQLAFEPTSSKTKRVKKSGEHYIFAVRTWRFVFRIEKNIVNVFQVTSGYSDSEMKNEDDPHKDKRIHSLFLDAFKN